jgi:hypothetical protein
MASATSSAIGMAVAGKSASVDIPKPRDGIVSPGYNTFTAVVANHPPAKKHGMLPTPPNSISPNLPPHKHPINHQANPPHSPPFDASHVDSDVDLHDALAPRDQEEHPPHNSLNAEALDSLGDLDSAGAITPGMLAKHHLPDILLNHGPLAIRHVMGYLTTSVPGFSRISSAKARRLVVAALEGKGSGAEGGGRDGEVQFEKVGWGRWDARLKGQPPRERASGNISPPPSMPSSYSQPGVHIPGQRSLPSGSDRLGTSLAGSSAFFTHSEMDDAEYGDVDMLEHEADKMSLDGNEFGYASSSEAPEPLMDQELGEGDITDEEDWASMGAAALRARSLPSSGRMPSGGGRLYQPIAEYSTTSQKCSRASGTPAVLPRSIPPLPVHNSGFSASVGVTVNDSREREAVEALLRLGSV